jgi:hypothetical protein
VMLKVMPPLHAAALGGTPRLMKDAVTARDVRHPGLAAIYDMGEQDGFVYFATEIVEGVPLSDWNRRLLSNGGELGFSPVITLVMAIIDVLIALHARGLIRVDLKPANIMLLSDPAEAGVRIKLAGVGLPAPDEAQGGTGTGFGGSPYRAPEALTANANALQPSADVYSVSMILYELLTGVPLSGHWRRPGEGRADVTPELDQLVQDGLSNNPRRRPQSLEAFRDALMQAAKLRDVRNDPSPSPGPGPRPDPKPDPEPGPQPERVKTWSIPAFLVPVFKALNMPLAAMLVVLQTILGWVQVATLGGRQGATGDKTLKRGAPPALIAAVVIGVLVLGAGVAWFWLGGGPGTVVAQNEELEGEPETEPDDRTPNLQPDELDTPEPEPLPTPRSRFASFNGYWTDDFGGVWNVSADNNGAVQAVSTAGMLTGSQMAGQLGGTAGGSRFDFLVGNAYGSGSASGTFDGACHINYQTIDPYGSGRMVNAVFHVNHQPGAPCP